MGARTDQVALQLANLRQALGITLRGLEAHATARQLRHVEDLDVERVRRLVRDGDLGTLSARESRYVILSFSEFTPNRLAALIKLRPYLTRAFMRQMLLQWESSLMRHDWDEYVQLFRDCPRSEAPIETPISVGEVAARDGAKNAAAAVVGRSVAEVYRTVVEEWRLQPSWSLTPHVLIEWMRRRVGARDALNASVGDLCAVDGDALRTLLLPPEASTMARRHSPTVKGLAHGSRTVQIRTIAVLLDGKFGRGSAVNATAFGALEPLFLRSTFGDPRAVTISDAWKEVRALASESYDAFLQGLIRDDLALFFRHLMQADDRERFWLRYLGSVRRTICVLDRDAYWHLERQLAGAPEMTRAALQRVIRTQSKNVDGSCAFCLFFDKFVMVEFSIVGNAGYLYDRGVFEERFASRLLRGELPSPGSLKDRAARARLIHRRDWQSVMEFELRRHGIQRDRRKTVSS
jgi:hypothetical protein